MAGSDDEEAKKLTFSFLRGVEADAGELDWPTGADVVRKALSESLNAKNVAFLLGAGCSSNCTKEKDAAGKETWRELGIPTMAPLAAEFTKARTSDEGGFPTAAERKVLTDEFGIDMDLHRFRSGLLRAILAIEETGYGSDTQRRVQAGCGSHRAHQWPDEASGCV